MAGSRIKTIGSSPNAIASEIKAPVLAMCRGHKAHEQRRRRLLAEVLRCFPGSYLDYGEDPVAEGLRGGWRRASPRAGAAWVIPHEADLEELYGWLYLGNWTIYGAETDDPRIVELLGAGPPWTELWNRTSVQFVLFAYHDNDPWYFGERAAP